MSRYGRILTGASQDSWVDYYRCDKCHVVWVHDKQNPEAPPRLITPPKG